MVSGNPEYKGKKKRKKLHMYDVDRDYSAS
jgi:hypothetical protein